MLRSFCRMSTGFHFHQPTPRVLVFTSCFAIHSTDVALRTSSRLHARHESTPSFRAGTQMWFLALKACTPCEPNVRMCHLAPPRRPLHTPSERGLVELLVRQ